jgi:oxygen-independent coproporphyrinogen-3 oxidase
MGPPVALGADLAVGPPVALYVHVPFCLSICPWCDFVVYRARPHGDGQIPGLVAALHAELALRADELDARWPVRPPLESVYFGGGTPSLLAARVLGDLLAGIDRRLGISVDAEITLEANPGPDDRGDLAGFVAAGVNRLSFGVQSLDAAELRRLGRRHGPEDAGAALAEARRAGVRSVSLDLLYDIPGSSVERWSRTLDDALALWPDHLSIYALSLDDPDAEGLTGGTGDHLPVRPGARRWRAAARTEQEDDRAAAQYRLAAERLDAAGWHGYELSSWARPGHESRHNRTYWDGRPYEAIGPGAHAFDGRTRRWNAAHLGAYFQALAPRPTGPPALPPGGYEHLDERTATVERAMLALRTDQGLILTERVQTAFGRDIAWGLATGLLAQRPGNRVALTTTGRLLSNELFARFL